jgi:hypothetical protein
MAIKTAGVHQSTFIRAEQEEAHASAAPQGERGGVRQLSPVPNCPTSDFASFCSIDR